MAPLNFEQAKKNKGIVTNAPTRQVAWSTGRNVRFIPGAVAKNMGKSLLATTPSARPIRNMFTFKGYDGIYRTIVCCDDKIYSYSADFATVIDITPTPAPSMGSTAVWTFTLVGGSPIISNGGYNQRWIWTDFSLPLAVLTNAPAIIRAMITDQNRLLVGNIMDGNYDYPSRVKWSEDNAPTSWTMDQEQKADSDDLVNPHGKFDAREVVKGFGYIGKRIGIWTERNIWYSDPIDSPAQHSIDIWHPGVGLLSPRLIVTVKDHNYFVGLEDIYDLGPEGLVAIGFDVRNFIFPNLNKAALANNFAFYRPWTREVFFCIATGANTTPDTAIVFNTELKNLSICDVDYISHNYSWLQTTTNWDVLPYGFWDNFTDSDWSQITAAGVIPYEVVGNSSGQILKMDSTWNNNGVAIQGYIETGDFGEADSRLSVFRLIPHLKPIATNKPLMIQAGGRDALSQTIKWSLPKPVQPGVDLAAGFWQNHKYVRFRFFTDQIDSPFLLEGYQAEMSKINS